MFNKNKDNVNQSQVQSFQCVYIIDNVRHTFESHPCFDGIIDNVPHAFESHPCFDEIIKNLRHTFEYVLKRVSFGCKDCTKELKLDYAYFLGQTS